MQILSSLRQLWQGSIRRQLIIGIALVHAVLMTLFIFDVVERQRSFLHEQSRVQSLALARNLASSSRSWVMSQDVIGLEEVLQALSRYPDLDYAMVLDPQGRVLGHSHSRWQSQGGQQALLNQYVVDAVSVRLLQHAPKAHVALDSRHVIDTAAPIMHHDTLLGWARVGLLQTQNQHNLSLVTTNGLIYTVVAIVIGVLFAYLMAGNLTRGISRLLQAMTQNRTTQQLQPVKLEQADEIGLLASEFNRLIDTLSARGEELRITKERFDLALQGADDGVWDYDLANNQLYFSARWKSMLGYSDEELEASYEAWSSRLYPDDLGAAEAAFQAHIEGKTPQYDATFRMQHKQGHYVWILARGQGIRDGSGQVTRVVGTHTDITRRKAIETELFQQKERLHVTLDAISDGVLVCDQQCQVVFMNPVAETLCAWQEEHAKGKLLDQVLPLYQQGAEQRWLNNAAVPPNRVNLGMAVNPAQQVLNQQTAISLQNNVFLYNHAGKHYELEVAASPLHDTEGATTGVVLTFRDVSDARELTRRMQWQADHDVLTGLPNRRMFEDHLHDALKRVRDTQVQQALLYLDLDQFKLVNDTCGHSAGDKLLGQLATLLQSQLKEHDLLARLGGDEFGVVLGRCSLDDALDIAQRLRITINEFHFVWEDQRFTLGVSIGLVMLDHYVGSLSDALSTADLACYAAKEQGRNRIHVHEFDKEEVEKQHQAMSLVNKIQQALNEDLFCVYCQSIEALPQGALAPHKSLYIEILLRFQEADGTMRLPVDIITAAERYGLMPKVDRWVIEHTFKQLSVVLKNISVKQAFKCSLNLSGASLTDENMLAHIRACLLKYEIPPECVCFEITETVAISNLAKAMNFIATLRALGCTFSLDDFGTGLSSFAYLKTLPVDYLKIDGSFVHDVLDNPSNRAIVESINQIGHTLGLKTIAEFVENTEIKDLLIEFGVDYAQGFGVHRPEPLQDYLGRIKGLALENK